MLVFTVRDAKAEAYMSPFYMKTRGEALRAFMDTVGNPDHLFSKHPEDYSLYALGAFDDSNGTFSLLQEPEFMGSAVDLVKPTA
ncbi:nonstructural protein [Microviridae sp.]|nr:nonstructural protein [Microviridae sp.]